MPYIPHTSEDVSAMLDRIDAAEVETLFDEIPHDLRREELNNIPEGMNEMEVLRHAQSLADNNQNGIAFIGAGAYEHHIPAVVWDIASRGEFLTAYTPYQAEASQGTLQLLYEFQTMIAELTGMDVANASMYDGATALAEAVLMAVRANKQSKTGRVLIAGTLHPYYRETVETIVRNQHIELVTLPIDYQRGVTDPAVLTQYQNEDITALVIAQPNFFGCLEAVDALCDWAHENHALVIGCVNPIALGLLKPPGAWGKKGADIACGEGQPLGAPLASGGPYFGFFSSRKEYVRQMPGRLIGQTIDKDGNTGYTLTLQAREQHIRRGKATSNICTNQGLLVTAAAIHMSLLGPEGLQAIAERCFSNTHALAEQLTAVKGVELVFDNPYFHEVLLRLNKPVSMVLAALRSKGIEGGYAVDAHYPQLANTLLVCATEMRSEEDIIRYAQALEACMD